LGKLITVVGNTGVGKTTFVQQLCTAAQFTLGLEQHNERPFQKLFSQDRQTYAIPNQIDYMLLRAEQEMEVRKGSETGVQDGGLDQDFNVFTRLFYQKGYLDEQEFSLCRRTYQLLRQLLPEPDLIIWLQAPVPVIVKRYQDRGRVLRIAGIDDLAATEILLQEWLGEISPDKLIAIDVANEERSYTKSIKKVLLRFNAAG
jgi:deoxyadenosine/deoxycytidine kinase